MKIVSFYYHAPRPEGMEKIIKYYQKREYRFISVEELLEYKLLRKPVKERLAFISLDDGWKQNLELLPLIEKYNVPICIFVSTQPVIDGNFWWEYIEKLYDKEKVNLFKLLPYDEFYRQLNEIKKQFVLPRSAMTVEEVIEISKHPLISIQAHTVNHPILTSVPDNILEMELRDSKKLLEEWTGNQIVAFSYPNGRNSFREIEVARKYFKISFTTIQQHISIDDDIMLLPRFSLTGQWPRDLLKVKGIWWRLKHLFQFFGFKKPKTIYG